MNLEHRYFNIRYSGNGKMMIKPCMSTYADFGTYRYNSETKLYETEWVAGWGCLRFGFDAFRKVLGSFETIILKHPEWTCEKYEEWLNDR
jgi:hypothetical protein